MNSNTPFKPPYGVYIFRLVRIGRICNSLDIGTICLQQNLLSRAFGIQGCVRHSKSFPGLMQAFSPSMDVVFADIYICVVYTSTWLYVYTCIYTMYMQICSYMCNSTCRHVNTTYNVHKLHVPTKVHLGLY